MGQQLADPSPKFFPTNHFQIAIHFYTWSSLKVPLDSLYYLVIHFCKLSDKSCSQINPKNSKSRYLSTMLPSEPECFWTKKRIHNKLKLCLNLKVSVLLLSNSKMPRYIIFNDVLYRVIVDDQVRLSLALWISLYFFMSMTPPPQCFDSQIKP